MSEALELILAKTHECIYLDLASLEIILCKSEDGHLCDTESLAP